MTKTLHKTGSRMWSMNKTSCIAFITFTQQAKEVHSVRAVVLDWIFKNHPVLTPDIRKHLKPVTLKCRFVKNE